MMSLMMTSSRRSKCSTPRTMGKLHTKKNMSNIMSDIQSDLRRGADERDGESGQPQDHEGDQGADIRQQ